ncbi:hypothetical protein NCCP2495_23150 [Dietzia sp. NCCP-2495]|uniref:NTP transferase domain-containing protein n=1 Tax=Dietzia sp. NCCP-2495 TaxID=2934675 RepID=UPI00223032E8|nr:NTP transferase domain-containing protein [Dietzia sp. NCCP-2495]GLB64436.1 hypothetical protein NCCP2495_23150 [Dietzia sp. NCCP-2495]
MNRGDGTVGAIVLTGGRGTRLGGVDKARLTVSGRPMVETVLAAARAVAGAVVTVGPGGDTREEPPHSGPVAGLAAGLAVLPEEADLVVVVACDLPGLDDDTLRRLVDTLREARVTARARATGGARAAGGAGAVAALGVDAAGHDQYLLAAWDRPALAARLDRFRAEGGVAGRAVRALYAEGEFVRVPVGAPAHDVDTWSDLAGRGPVAFEHVGEVLRAGLGESGVAVRAPLDAVGGVLAEPLVAADPMPRGRVSAMDGYALAGPGPWRLIGVARRAGDSSPASLAPGTAATIATGALAPRGTDRVLRHELVTVTGSTDSPDTPSGPATVTALPEAEGTNDLRPVGEDWPAGVELASAGALLDAALASAALSGGVDGVRVRGPLTATVVTTGDEVLPATTRAPLPPGRIRDTVGPLLPGVLARAGFAAAPGHAGRAVRHCPDTPADFDALLSGGAGEDVLVLVGATGRGVADHLRSALARAGAKVVLDGVRVRPGGSQLVAALPDGRVLLGLPGNPAAAVCAAATTGRALVDARTGRLRTPTLVRLPDVAGLAAPGRSRILPARPDGAGGWSVTARVRTAHLADLVGAPALALVPEAADDDLVEVVDWWAPPR